MRSELLSRPFKTIKIAPDFDSIRPILLVDAFDAFDESELATEVVVKCNAQSVTAVR